MKDTLEGFLMETMNPRIQSQKKSCSRRDYGQSLKESLSETKETLKEYQKEPL